MYNIFEQKTDNDEPWQAPFSQRVKDIFDAKKINCKIVMYIYECADTSTFRYRVYNICQSLELSLEWKGVYFFKNELNLIKSYLKYIDIIVIARFRWSFEIQSIIDFVHSQNKKILFDIDDMVYNLDYLPTIVNTLSVDMKSEAAYDYWFAYVSRLSATAKKCDGALTTNEYLAHMMEKDLNVPAYVIPNYTNRLQEMVSESYFNQKKNQYSNREKFIIGYFSGTPSHINDFLVVAPEIKILLDKFPAMYFRIVGFMELPHYLHEYETIGRIERRPLVNFIQLQKEIAEVDINIAPLVNNSFSNCKSELKFFEASIVGTITCATPTYTFSNAIKDGENGFLCNLGQWENKITKIYLDVNNENRNIIINAHNMCIQRYSYSNQVILIEKVLNNVLHS